MIPMRAHWFDYLKGQCVANRHSPAVGVPPRRTNDLTNGSGYGLRSVRSHFTFLMTLCAIAATIAAGTTQLLAAAPGPAAANSGSPVAEAGSEDLFTKAIAPLLESRCVECHNSEDASGGSTCRLEREQ